MANVYRRGTKSVHRSIREAAQRFDVNECNLDPGGEWGPVVPAGPRCEACFGGVRTSRRPNGRRPALVAATAAAVFAASVVFASSLDAPVNIAPFGTASPSPTFASVTPGPSVLPAAPTFEPVPTLGPLPTYPPAPTFGPLPTWPPFPPLPTLRPLPNPSLPPPPLICRHPGQHVGVLDPCKWPHQ